VDRLNLKKKTVKYSETSLRLMHKLFRMEENHEGKHHLKSNIKKNVK
jgi:hypothetical protein